MKIKNTYHKKMVFTVKEYGPFGIGVDEVKEVERRLGEILLQNKYIEKVEDDREEIEKISKLEEVGFSSKVLDAFEELDIKSVEELTKMDLNDIKKIDGIGEKTIEKIEEKINNLEDKKVVNKEIN